MPKFEVRLHPDYQSNPEFYRSDFVFSVSNKLAELEDVYAQSAAGRVFTSQLNEFLKNIIDAGGDRAEFSFEINTQGDVEIRIKDNGTKPLSTEKQGTYDWRETLFSKSEKRDVSRSEVLGGRNLGVAAGAFFLDAKAKNGRLSLLQNTDGNGVTVVITSSQENCSHLVVQEQGENIRSTMIHYAINDESLYFYALKSATERKEKCISIVEMEGAELNEKEFKLLEQAKLDLQKTNDELAREIIHGLTEQLDLYEPRVIESFPSSRRSSGMFDPTEFSSSGPLCLNIGRRDSIPDEAVIPHFSGQTDIDISRAESKHGSKEEMGKVKRPSRISFSDQLLAAKVPHSVDEVPLQASRKSHLKEIVKPKGHSEQLTGGRLSRAMQFSKPSANRVGLFSTTKIKRKEKQPSESVRQLSLPPIVDITFPGKSGQL